jgi:hypothetical protein
MGTYPVAIAGIGMVLNLTALEGETYAVSSCQHEERRGQKFCPVCGQLVQTFQRTDTERRNDFNDFFHEEMSLPTGWVEDWGEYSGVFIGWGLTVNQIGDTEFSPLGDMPSPHSILLKIKEIFVDWPEVIDETKFGFHLLQSGH